MTDERRALVEEFIAKFGKDIQDQADKQRGIALFEQQYLEDDTTPYVVNEDGHLTPIQEDYPYKKTHSRREIADILPYEQLHPLIQPFTIFRVFYPYLDRPDTYSVRPALAVPISSNQFRFMPITSGDHTDIIFRRYEFLLDWRKAGLAKSCYLRPNIVKNPEDIVFTRDSYMYGALSNRDIQTLIHKREQYQQETLTNPIPFLYWLVENRISDPIPIKQSSAGNNVNPIQSIDDVVRTKTANCVDISIITYKMTTHNRSEFPTSTIANAKWVTSPNSSTGHVFPIFTYHSNTYILDYDQDHFNGDFKTYKKKDFYSTAKSYADYIVQVHPDYRVKSSPCKIQVLSDSQLLSVNDSYQSQLEWLRTVGFYYTNTMDDYLQEQYSTFGMVDYTVLKGV